MSKATDLYLWCDMHLDGANVEKVENLIDRMIEYGYSFLVLGDTYFTILKLKDKKYIDNLKRISAYARKKGIEVIPHFGSLGHGNTFLLNDPNLAEGIAIKNAPFVVTGNTATPEQGEHEKIQDGGFDQYTGNTFSQWTLQDLPGIATFADRNVKYCGSASLRVDVDAVVKADPQMKRGRIMAEVQVAPWRQYRLKYRVKTEDLQPNTCVNAYVVGNGSHLCFYHQKTASTQDWEQYSLVFNSMASKCVQIYLGTWGGDVAYTGEGKSGKFWIDDVSIEHVGALNILRREGCPLKISTESGDVLEEGLDFERLEDEWFKRYTDHVNVPPNIVDYTHNAPVIKLTSEKAKAGGRIFASFYAPLKVLGSGITAVCLSEEKVFDILRDCVSVLSEIFHPKSYMLDLDEVRIANWCEACRNKNMSSGQLIAECTNKLYNMVKRIDSAAELFTWSDMYDVHHNAGREPYYHVPGGFRGAWACLQKGMKIFNWSGKPESVANFQEQFNIPQVIAGYYDSDPNKARGWVEECKGKKGVIGVMYTTWTCSYAHMQAFAEMVRDALGG